MKTTARQVIDGPLPDGDLPKGQVILSPPKNRQFLLGTYASVRSWIRNYGSTRKEITDILLTDNRSWGKRIERIRGVMMLKANAETYSPETMHDAGLRRAECVCYDGCDCDHCEHPPRQ